MEEIIGQITDKAIKEGISGSGKQWSRATFTINGRQYATFDLTIARDNKIGDNVKMRGAQNGKYWQMESMEKVENAASSEGVNTLKTPEVERVVEPKLRTSRTFQEIGAGEIIKEAVKIYTADQNVDYLKFGDVVDLVREEFVKVRDAL